MTPALLALRSLIKLVPWQLWAALALTGLVLTYGHFKYREGYNEATAKVHAASVAEMARQESANRKALDEAARLNNEHLQSMIYLDKKVEELSIEAKRDPRSGARSLGADSVRRIDSIR